MRRSAYWIRRLRPDVVLGHDPWKRYRLHPDHRHAGFLAVDGIVAARDPHFFPEQDVDAPPPVGPAAVGGRRARPRRGRQPATSTPSWPPCSSTAASSARRWTSTTADNGAEVDAFAARVRNRLADHGALAGLAQGEAFKAIREL